MIFVDKNGTSRSVMAGSLFTKLKPGFCEVFVRGLIVPFPEPVNPKVAAVMISDGIDMAEYESEGLSDTDIEDGTLIFAIDKSTRDGIISSFEGATGDNTFDICSFTGAELEVTDPYGGSLTTYGICYESLKTVIEKLIEILEEKDE